MRGTTAAATGTAAGTLRVAAVAAAAAAAQQWTRLPPQRHPSPRVQRLLSRPLHGRKYVSDGSGGRRGAKVTTSLVGCVSPPPSSGLRASTRKCSCVASTSRSRPPPSRPSGCDAAASAPLLPPQPSQLLRRRLPLRLLLRPRLTVAPPRPRRRPRHPSPRWSCACRPSLPRGRQEWRQQPTPS